MFPLSDSPAGLLCPPTPDGKPVRVLSPRTLRAIREVLEQTDRADLVAAVDFALKPKRSVAPARELRVSQKEERRKEWEVVRSAVLERAAGVCEGCGAQPDRLAADHMFGGAGRRVSLESKFTVWALCFTCDQAKTANRPDAVLWLQWFIRHAKHRMARAGQLAEANGYCSAADIAQARLDALELLDSAKGGGT